MGDVTMDDAGVSLLTIDARDGSVIQRVQAGGSFYGRQVNIYPMCRKTPCFSYGYKTLPSNLRK